MNPAVEKADLLIDLHRYDEARTLLARRLAQEPDDVRAWVKLARSHLGRQQDKAQALDATRRALELNPEDRGALVMHAEALRYARHPGRWDEVETSVRRLVELAPADWWGYARAADLLARANMVRHQERHGGVRPADRPLLMREPTELARRGVELGPQEVYAYEVGHFIAYLAGDQATADLMDEALLRLDPQHKDALVRQTERAAGAPGTKATAAASLYADTLAVAPESGAMRHGLDNASYRLLRGMRWLALGCLALAAAGLDLFAGSGSAQRSLPLPLGQRLWDLVPMTVIWLVGALLRYRGLRAGVRVNLLSVVRRRRWPRVVLCQAGWSMVCALLITQVPWTDRAAPQLLFWSGVLATLATVWFDKKKTS